MVAFGGAKVASAQVVVAGTQATAPANAAPENLPRTGSTVLPLLVLVAGLLGLGVLLRGSSTLVAGTSDSKRRRN